MLFSTIISPEKDGIIEGNSYTELINSISQCYKKYDLSVRYRNVKINTFNKCGHGDFREITAAEYTSKRDLFNLFNTADIIDNYSKQDVLCFLDVDTFLVRPLKLTRDFDIAFTIKERGKSNLHITNMGTFFVNLTKDNKRIISDFFTSNMIDTGVLDKSSEGSVNFWKYLSLPEIKPHLEYLDDYIVQQDYVNSICFARQWFEPGLYDLNGLKFKLLDENYNRFWYFGESYNSNTYIYHFKGRRETKLGRAQKLKELHVSHTR